MHHHSVKKTFAAVFVVSFAIEAISLVGLKSKVQHSGIRVW
jgi:hypothetical protein